MDDSLPGTSGIKRRKLVPKNPSRLTEDELSQYLDISDSDTEYQPDSDDSVSEEDEEDDVGITPMDDNIDEAERTEIAEFLTAWQDETIGMKTLDFIKTNQMLIDLPVGAEPYEYFKLLVDDNILSKIIAETNDFAESVFLESPGNQRARISEWKHLTKEEFLIFLGLVYHMGTIKLNRLQDYWKTHRLFNLKCFSEQMSRDRFLLILRCLHFSRNPNIDEPKPDDRLYKIRPVIDYFNEKMREIYYPGKNLSLDESLVLWRGRLIFRQYIANKRHRYGLKLYMLTEPSGLVLNFAVYTGQNDDMGGKGHAKKVVLHLMKDNLNKGHSLYMDNFYNSCDLAQTLLDNKTYCTGTLRGDRKGNPPEVIHSEKFLSGDN